jgi:hypothetical protein
MRKIGKSFYTFERTHEGLSYELVLHRQIKSVRFIEKRKSKTKQIN